MFQNMFLHRNILLHISKTPKFDYICKRFNDKSKKYYEEE